MTKNPQKSLNCPSFQRVKYFAFTLAETLIVIGIIGVVAALTLPNLNHATGDKEKVTRVIKMYSSLNEAFDRAEAIYGPSDEWRVTSNCEDNDWDCQYDSKKNLYTERIAEFMKVSKINDEGGYFHEVILADGSSFSVGPNDGSTSCHYGNNASRLADIYIDIDGPNKGKNDYGYDLFSFEMLSEGIFPESTRNDDLSYTFINYGGQSRWIIENGNLDYLKVNEDGECPNGTQLSWTVTSCN